MWIKGAAWKSEPERETVMVLVFVQAVLWRRQVVAASPLAMLLLLLYRFEASLQLRGSSY